MQKSFLGKKLLIITAHPDDESYVCAGTIYKNFQQGGWSVLICGTYGERGTSHLKRKLSTTQLKRIRQHELTAVSRLLHIVPAHIIGVPDGRVRLRTAFFYRKALSLAKQYKPQAIVSFGEDGITGHLDHIAAGAVARRIARKLGVPFYAFTLPPSIAKDALAWLKTRRQAPHYARTVRYRKPTIKIAIDSRIKKQALRCHASQMDGKNAFTGFPPFAVRELLKAEYFVGAK